jgi:hypothetical protein
MLFHAILEGYIYPLKSFFYKLLGIWKGLGLGKKLPLFLVPQAIRLRVWLSVNIAFCKGISTS